MKLKYRIFWLIFFLIALFSIPMTLYFLNTTRSVLDLGLDPVIESSLKANLEKSTTPAERDAGLEALKRYLQAKSLKSIIIRQSVFVSVFAIMGIISAALVLALIFTGKITRPLADLTEASQRIARGELGLQVPAKAGAGKEIASLMKAFNQMAARLKDATEKLRISESKATWREVARTIAHEIKNPLTPIKLSAQRLKRKYSEKAGDFEKALETAVSTILNEIDNMERLVDAFHKYAKLPDPVPAPEDIGRLIRETAALLPEQRDNISITAETGFPRVVVDSGQFREALFNLLKNAVEATDEKTRRISITACMDGANVCIRVADNGPGIPEENIRKLFVPYFTTKTDGNGIGLALAERMIAQVGGRMTYEGKPGSGAVFVIRLKPEDLMEETWPES